MKTQITRSALKAIAQNHNKKIVYIPYGAAQSLFLWREPEFYNYGVYGWNYDAYIIGDAIICTGYRAYPGRRAENYAYFEKQAEHIRKDKRYLPSTKKQKLEELRACFAAQA